MIKFRPIRSLPLRLLVELSRTTGWTFGMGSITSVKTTDPLVTLTFDGGPDDQWTPKVLDVLAEYQAKATFFVIGKYVQKHPEIIQRMVAEGHELGNHTWIHPSMPLISSHERREEILRCDKALQSFGKTVRLYRPPYYDQDMASWFDLFRMGYIVTIGNRAANDWEDRDTGFIYERLISTVSKGDIVLLHDSVCDQRYRSREPMIGALSLFLKERHHMFRFITISDLLNSGKPQKEIWLRRPNLNRFASYERDI